MSPRAKTFRRLRRLMGGVLAFGVIGFALLLSLTAVFTPWLQNNPEKIRQFLSQQTQHEVQFQSVSSQWNKRGPVFALSGLSLQAKNSDRPFVIEQAEFALDFYAWMQKGRSFAELRLIGLEVEVERDAKTGWHIKRLGDFERRDDEDADPLANLPAIQLRDAVVQLRDPALRSVFTIKPVNLGIARELGGHRIAARLGGRETNGIQFVCQLRERSRHANCHFAWRDLRLNEWFGRLNHGGMQLANGVSSGQVWARYQAGQLQSAQAEWQAQDATIKSLNTIVSPAGKTLLPIAQLPDGQWSARFDRHDEKQWQFDWMKLEGRVRKSAQSHLRVQAKAAAEGQTRYQFEADRLRLGAWPSLLVLHDAVPDKVRRRVYPLAMDGELRAVRGHVTDQRDFKLQGAFVNARTDSVESIPGVDRINGRFFGDQDAVVFEPDPEQDIAISYPHIFRRAIQTKLRSARVVWRPGENGWWLDFHDMHGVGEGFGIRGNASLFVPPGTDKPFLDGHAEVLTTAAASAKQFWPMNVMSKEAVAWLDRALVSGEVRGGRAVLRGDFDDWPFSPATGHFDAQAELHQMRLKYHPDWPVAEQVQGLVRFEDAGLQVNVERAEIAGNRISKGAAAIARLSEPNLQLQVEGEGKGAQLLDLLRASPIASEHAEWLQSLSLTGDGAVQFGLQQPLGNTPGEFAVDGQVKLQGSEIADPRWKMKFNNSEGTVRFSHLGFDTENLKVHIGEEPATLQLKVGSGFVANPGQIATARLSGQLSMRSVFAGVPQVASWFDRFNGRSPWLMQLEIDQAPAGKDSKKRLQMESSLIGTAMDLPAPFAKTSETAMPMKIALDLPLEAANLDLNITGIGHLRARLPDEAKKIPFAGAFRFGLPSAGALPARGLRVDGQANELDLLAWSKLAGADASSGDLSVAMEVSADRLLLGDRALPDTKVQLAQNTDATVVLFSGDSAAGTVRIPRQTLDKTGITARFEKFHLPPAPTIATPVTANTVDDASNDKPRIAQTDPSKLPPLHLWAKDLKLGHTHFGETRIETYPVENGLRIDAFDTQSPNFQLRAQGHWRMAEGRAWSDIDANLSSRDLGKLLDGFGFKGLVDDGETVAQFSGQWPGTPGDFSLLILDGKLKVNVGEGRMVDVEPGAGRIFGLLSLTAIPRRLSLDFSDFFQKGMGFDSIEGEFQLKDGNAFTDRLFIKAPSAEIVISGRTGLRDRDYDQHMQVTPKVSGALTVVGAIAGGPVGAAAGTLAQGLLGGGINSMMTAKYTVKGSWDKPQIELIEKRKAEKPAENKK